MVSNRRSGATVAAAILVLANIILNAIAIFQSDLDLVRSEDIYIYLVIDIVYAAAFVILGIGLLADSTGMEKAGSYTGAAASVLKMAKACTWIFPSLPYMSELEIVRYGTNLLGMAAGIIGFLLLARSFGVQGYGGKASDKKLAAVFLLASMILETIYALMALYWGYYSFGDLIWLQFSGQMSMPVNYLALAGIIVYLITSMRIPQAVPGAIPAVPAGYGAPVTQAAPMPQPASVPQVQAAPVTPAAQTAAAAPADSERIKQIRMLKDLKDLGIITEEEFFDRIRSL